MVVADLFTKLNNILKLTTGSNLRKKDVEEPLDTLTAFCESNACETSMNDVAVKVVKSGLGPAIRDSVKAFITDTDSKMRAVWLWGAPNCGKTMLAGML
jgi:hypothetical protein